MSYSKHSYFNEDANFNEVKFGANNPVLETELNELQQIQELSKKNLIRDLLGSGLIKVPTSMAFISSSVYTLKLTGDTVAYVDGSRIFIPSDTRVSAPSGSASMLFIEVWTEEVNCDSTLTKYGGESTATIDNYLKDPRVPKETARRIVTKWRLRCDKGTSMTSMKVRGKLSGTSTTSFSALTSGIYKGVDESASFDGVVFALPLASISSSKVVTPNYRKIILTGEVQDALDDLSQLVDEKANQDALDSLSQLVNEKANQEELDLLSQALAKYEFGFASNVTTVTNGAHKQIIKKYVDGRMEIIQTFALLSVCNVPWGNGFIHNSEGTTPSAFGETFISKPQISVSAQGNNTGASFSVVIKGEGTTTRGPIIQIFRPTSYTTTTEWRVLIHAWGMWKEPESPNTANLLNEPTTLEEKEITIEYGPIIVAEQDKREELICQEESKI